MWSVGEEWSPQKVRPFIYFKDLEHYNTMNLMYKEANYMFKGIYILLKTALFMQKIHVT